MPLFDRYVMVDWSGGNSRRSNRKDAIWIAHGDRTAATPTTMSPPSRSEAEKAVRELVAPFAASKKPQRVLVCFDFAYGYPKGFASCLGVVSPARGVPPWRRVWQYLAIAVRDDLRMRAGGKPSNKNNRFEVADVINRHLSPSTGPLGPFWCLFKPGSQEHIPQGQPQIPFVTRSGPRIRSERLTDVRAQSDTAFRLFGTGSVGSQILTGIPRVARLRFDPALSSTSRVWPFETGWAAGDNWLTGTIRILYAEIYPSVREPLADAIKDRGQVRAMWRWAHELDIRDELQDEFRIPNGVAPGSADDRTIRREEGWILGAH